jgi:glycosyltransferase involved in cell wall biosynthesis
MRGRSGTRIEETSRFTAERTAGLVSHSGSPPYFVFRLKLLYPANTPWLVTGAASFYGRDMKVIAVLPAFNAEKTLRKTYDAIPKDHVQEIILVDDASTDHTVEQAEKINDLIVILHEQNKGYGGNQKTCYQAALKRGADVVVMIHPDFQYDPQYVPHMIAPVVAGEADMVLGSRFVAGDPRSEGMVWWRYWGNRFLTSLQNSVLGIHLSEGHSGYRAYSRKLLETIPYQKFSDNFVFDSQMIVAAAQLGMKITEVRVPTRYTSESSSISFMSSVRYGFSTLGTLIFKSPK